MEQQWSENAARTLVDLRRADAPRTVTWFNHHTLQVTMDAGTELSKFDYIGLDGSFLRRLIAPNMARTSADLMLPKILDQMGPGCRIGLIGSTSQQLEAAAEIIKAGPNSPDVALTIDGFSGLADRKAVIQQVDDAHLDILVLGLGAPLQDEWALILKDTCASVRLIITCGGWLDQITQPTYYPSFAYKYRLNWLIRVAREPQRLWRRYTLEAVRAARVRNRLRAALLTDGAGGLEAMERASRSGHANASQSTPREAYDIDGDVRRGAPPNQR
ncbi:WecB/TagA/CpsF family glycosyltransferase [Quadrisphaera setariae]|uniref:WecB/TagA/CpsF family glycosyltransferase n=1 Tax=Quadrisphaera setariae TaxID=2593304 RepID=A0A5C8ZGV4_9ACTN|nr:WecB/TagA/CpsF family glycosyltransferase [Quadrisphaera setariae]TXR56313.1 WecB/TagA/CpsF family glycosyltransferase [Quadrisphaera setariae]